MAIRFQADADLNQIIVSAVVRRVPAIDFRTATGANLAGLMDQDVLALAARDARILVSHDQATMPRHFKAFIRSQRSSGLIVIPQHVPPGAAVDDLILIWTATEAEESTSLRGWRSARLSPTLIQASTSGNQSAGPKPFAICVKLSVPPGVCFIDLSGVAAGAAGAGPALGVGAAGGTAYAHAREPAFLGLPNFTPDLAQRGRRGPARTG